MSVTGNAAPPSAEPALKLIDEMSPVQESDIIPLLQRLQDLYGYLPREIILEIASRTGLPASRMFGVATFYEQFHLKPRGRHIIRCCRGTACHVRGGKRIIEAIKRELGIDEGGTTEDLRFTFETVACLGTCALAPVMMIGDKYYGKVTPKRARQILDQIAQEEG